MESKYLERFIHYSAKKKGKLFGENLVVEILDQGERTSKGGLIIPVSNHARAEYGMLETTVGIVLEVGEGYFDDDTGADIPLKRKVGEVVWLSEGNLRFCTTFPCLREAVPEKKIAVISENHIYKAWDNIEAYMDDQGALSKGLE